MKFADALAPIDDVGEKVIDTTEEYVKKADDVILGRVMRIMDHVSIRCIHMFACFLTPIAAWNVLSHVLNDVLCYMY